ncbi:hypothetical protein RAA17_02125 [Komagataeibacter rhaeticus]|nr:hypothetical protein [Komagataeibacter rhaeticus]
MVVHPAQAASILARGQVLMSSAPRDAVMMLPAHGGQAIGVSADMALSYGLSWGVVAGQPTARLGQSRDLLHFIVQPDRQAAFMARYGAPPGPDAGHPARVLPVDVQFWQGHYTSLSRRFDIWLRGLADDAGPDGASRGPAGVDGACVLLGLVLASLLVLWAHAMLRGTWPTQCVLLRGLLLACMLPGLVLAVWWPGLAKGPRLRDA